MFRRGKHIGLLLMLLCCANLRSQVVVTLPFFDDFNSYTEDSIRHIDATHYPWNESKIDLLKEHKVSILIDDKWANYKDAIDAGIFCYLMDAPHNKYYNVGHRRVYDLNLPIK